MLRPRHQEMVLYGIALSSFSAATRMLPGTFARLDHNKRTLSTVIYSSSLLSSTCLMAMVFRSRCGFRKKHVHRNDGAWSHSSKTCCYADTESHAFQSFRSRPVRLRLLQSLRSRPLRISMLLTMLRLLLLPLSITVGIRD